MSSCVQLERFYVVVVVTVVLSPPPRLSRPLMRGGVGGSEGGVWWRLRAPCGPRMEAGWCRR